MRHASFTNKKRRGTHPDRATYIPEKEQCMPDVQNKEITKIKEDHCTQPGGQAEPG